MHIIGKSGAQPEGSEREVAGGSIWEALPALRFLRLLQRFHSQHVLNPWTDDNSDDLPTNGPAARRERLVAHFAIQPAQLLIGEASGYQGCRVTGIPFTSERLLMSGSIPRIDGLGARLSARHIPWSEPSATVLWPTLHELGIARTTVLWNAFPWHPHRPHEPHSNRSPTRAECKQGLPVLDALLTAFPRARLFAVGRHAERALLELGRKATMLRHPSMSGATEFRRALRASCRRRS